MGEIGGAVGVSPTHNSGIHYNLGGFADKVNKSPESPILFQYNERAIDTRFDNEWGHKKEMIPMCR